MKISSLIVITLLSAAQLFGEAPDDGDWEFYRKHHSAQPEGFRRKLEDKKASTFRFLPEISTFVQRADTVSVFEGLPHQFWEPELLKQEKKNEKTVLIFGFPFYEQPALLAEKRSVVFRKLLAGTNGLEPLLKPALCGEFHPDYAIRFSVDDRVCNVLICHGCSEAAIELGDRKVYCSLKPGWRKALREFRNKRPE